MLLTTRRAIVTATVLVVAYAGWRGWDTWPAVDRHQDRRGEQLIARLLFGVDGQNATLVTQMDWQLENVLLYYSRFVRPDLSWIRLPEVMLRLPYLVEETHARGRDIVLSADAARDAVGAYGSAIRVVPDPVLPAPTLIETIERIPRGAPYVFCFLSPLREQQPDSASLGASLRALTGGDMQAPPGAAYWVMAGLAGERPAYTRGESRPFRDSVDLLGDPFTIRMESWLATDTFRRAGFGQVLRGRERVLIVERGINLVWFQPDGSAAEPVYAAGLFATRPRYRIPVSTPQLARAQP